jgi:ABC-type transporter Mla MlaB component
VLQGNLEVVALEQDPEIEGAAISFANGDETAAESTLLKLINPDSRRREEVEVWLALFDLYRAADQYDAFNDLAPKFITLFGRSAPQWERMRDQEMSVTTDLAPQVPRTGFFTWTSPPQLNAEALETLTGAVAYAAAPWRLDWRAIKGIKPDVLPQFNALFTQWADTPTQLQFLGSEQLLAVLIEQSPIGNQSVNPAWWRVRMALLRLMGATDQFDQTALNYCITYEISPPAWIPPKSSYVPLDADVQPESEPVNDRSAAQQTFALTTTTGELPAATEAFKAALSGEILGSVRPMLAALPNDLERIKTIDFNCRALRRVDFGAAGGLLNWSIEQQGQGRTVTFRDMHRLLAAFFSVIGINAAARVILRKD